MTITTKVVSYLVQFATTWLTGGLIPQLIFTLIDMSIRPQHTLVLLAVVSMTFLANSITAQDENKNPRFQNRSSQSNQSKGTSNRTAVQHQRLREQNQSSSSSSQSRTSVRPTTRPTTTPSTSRNRTTGSSGTSNNRTVTTPSSNNSRYGRNSSNSADSSDRNRTTTTTTSRNDRYSRTATMEGSRNSSVTSDRRQSPTVVNRNNSGSRSTGSSSGSPWNRGSSNSGIDRDSRYPTVASGSINRGSGSTGSSSGSYSRGGNSNSGHDNNRTGGDSRTGRDSNSRIGSDRGGRDDSGRRDHDDDDKDYGRGHDSHGKGSYNDYNRRNSYNRYNSPLRRYGSDLYNDIYYHRYSSRYPSSSSIHTTIILGAAAVSHGSRVLSSERRAEAVGYAILFEDGSFRGEALEIYAGESVYNLKDIQLGYSKTFNDRISSLKIYGRLTVVLHTDAAFGGDRIFVHGDMIDFSRISSMRRYNDRISSIEVLQGIVDEHNYLPARGGEYAVYGDPNPGVEYAVGDSSSYQGSVPPPPNASVRATAPQPSYSGQANARAHLFDQPGFRGNQIVLTGGFSEADLAAINKGLAGSWDNTVASIRIEGGAEVFLYTDRDFLGQAIALNNSVENLSLASELVPFVGTISSVIVNSGR